MLSSDDEPDESSDPDFSGDPASTAPLDHAAIRARASQLLLGLRETTSGASDNGDEDDSTTSSEESFQGGKARSRAEDLLRSSAARPTVSQLRQLVETRASAAQHPSPPSDPADRDDGSTAPATSDESAQESVSLPQQEQKQSAAAALSAEPPRWRFVKTAKKSTGYSSAMAGSYIEGKTSLELAKKYEAPIVDLTKPKKEEVQVKELESRGPTFKQFSKELNQVGKLSFDGSQHLDEETFEGSTSVPRGRSKTVPEKIVTDIDPMLKFKNIGKLLFFDPDDYIGTEYEHTSRPNRTDETAEDDSSGDSEDEVVIDAKSIVNDDQSSHQRWKKQRLTCLYLLPLLLLLAGAIAGVIASTRDPQSEPTQASVGARAPQNLTTYPSSMPSKLTGSLLFVNEESPRPSRSPSSEDIDFHTMPATSLLPTMALVTLLPSTAPSYFASPSRSPTRATLQPYFVPQSVPPTTSDPTNIPTDKPSETLTLEPSIRPSLVLSAVPSVMTSGRPSSQPSEPPSTAQFPSQLPSGRPISSAPTSLAPLVVGACPEEYMPLSRYSAGTQVQLGGIVFECVDIACSYGGFEPEPSLHDGLWQQVWDVIGTCSGSFAPTTSSPVVAPSFQPSDIESKVPSEMPSKHPTTNPTSSPIHRPSSSPTKSPTRVPSPSPSTSPLASPTAEPSATPSESPLANPTDEPTISPSGNPTKKPSLLPSVQPSDSPSTSNPTRNPTPVPTEMPTNNPTINYEPTVSPTCSINGNFNLCVALDMSGSVCNENGGGLCKDCFPDGWERGDENTCNQGGLTRSLCCPNFANMIQFTKDLISDLGELPTDQDFSIVHFGDDAVIADTLESSRQAVKTMNRLEYSGGMTDMTGALNSCQSTLRGAPVDRTNLLLIITDGSPNTILEASAAASEARSEGTFIIPILIEEDTQPQNVMFLEDKISSDGRVFVSTFDGLNDLQDAIFEQVTCQA